jgi:hypothetical protein
MADRRQQLKYMQDRCHLCPRKVEETIRQFGVTAFHKAFQFHHVDPTTKHADYDNLIRRVISTEQLDELDKCVLLCNWCHSLLENQNNRVALTLEVTVDGRSATQTIRGQVLVNQETGVASFVSNERVKVIPYRVQLGTNEPQLAFGTDLEDKKLLVEYLASLPEHRTIQIGTWPDGRPLLRAVFIEPDGMEVKYDISFPVFQTELRGETNVWTRNGLALTDNGVVLEEGEVTFEGKIPAKPRPE